MSMTPHRVGNQQPPGEPVAATGDSDRFQRRTGIAADDYAVLTKVPLFSGLPEPALRTLLADAWVQNIPRNTVLFLQGEPATRCYIVLEGWVKLFRSMIDGHETVIAVFTRGESFAEAAIFDRANFPVGGAVVEDSRLLVIPAEPFMRRLSENGDYALKVLASMSRHLRRLVSQVERLTHRSSAERVAEFLLRLSPVIAGPVVIQLPLDKALIAGRLGMQPETFSRSLAKLRGIGVLCKGPEVTVPDVMQLRRFADGADS